MEWLIPYKIETPSITIPIGSTVRLLKRVAIQAVSRMLR